MFVDFSVTIETTITQLDEISLDILMHYQIFIFRFVGKSTLLSALSGRLMPIGGSRIEGDGLELGVFTQDLAQDLVSLFGMFRGKAVWITMPTFVVRIIMHSAIYIMFCTEKT